MTFKGKHHTDAWKEKMSLAKIAEKNPNWKGNNVMHPRAGNLRARRLIPCPKGKERHHKDGNPLNNNTDNIEFITRKQHMESDGRLQRLHEGNKGKHWTEEQKDKLSKRRIELYSRLQVNKIVG